MNSESKDVPKDYFSPKKDTSKFFSPPEKIPSKICLTKNISEIEPIDKDEVFVKAKFDLSCIMNNENVQTKNPIIQSNETMVKKVMNPMKTMDSQPKFTNEKVQEIIDNPQDKIETMDFKMSIGFEMNDSETNPQTLVIQDGPDLYQTILRTACAYAIRCSHGRILVQKLKNHDGFWFPYAYADENEKYSKTIDSIYDSFLNEFKSENQIESFTQKNLSKRKYSTKFLSDIQLYNIYRFQIPDGQFISRYIFLALWTGLDPRLVCCKNTANIRWLPLEHTLSRKIPDILWGNEVHIVAAVLLEQHLGNQSHFYKYPNILEFTSAEVLKYVSGSSFQSPNRSLTSNQMLILLNDAKFLERDVVKIYCDYVQHCFPASNMTYSSFSEYFNKLNLLTNEGATLRNIFRSMCHRNKNFMLFNEFLLGLAALSSNSNSQLRCAYVFRYYDKNSDNFLDEDDFRRMIYDIHDRKMLSCDPNEVEKDVQIKLSQVELFDNKKRISLDAFIREISSGRLTGVEHLFHVNAAILEKIHTRHLYQFILNKSGKPFATWFIGTCSKCKPKNYSLAYNAVKLNNQGRIEESKPLISFNCGEIDVELQFKKKTNEMRIKHSIEVVFNENSVANRVLAIIRKMVDFNKLPRKGKDEISQYVIANLTVDLIVQLCKEVTEIFLIEPRVLKVNTPCIVMGDLHGNINDLLTYEKQLWPLAPTSNAPNVLFLGDYVDRGDYSIEVICYLFAIKILAPTKFFLLRGNHEIRSIQRNFTFARECMLKYFHQNGQRIFEEFNSSFDYLPLVGIIDESIFCAHGGIPFSVNKIEELYKIPMPLPDPENQSIAAWEILWSDPITDEEYIQICQFKNQSIDNGYTENLRRSTAYYFTEKALINFLKINSLSHVIRAHELEAEGYRFHHSGLLITVFSSSRYCNTNNKSAAIFISSRENEGFIKVITLET